MLFEQITNLLTTPFVLDHDLGLMNHGKAKENLELFCFTFETKTNLEQIRCDMWIGLETCPTSIMQLVGQTPLEQFIEKKQM
jgi:hypothetical protein